MSEAPRFRFRQPHGLILPASIQGRRERPGREGISLVSGRHLPRNKQVNLSSMIFVVGEAFVNLSARNVREAAFDKRIDCLAVLNEANDVMHADARSLDDWCSTADAGFAHDVPIAE